MDNIGKFFGLEEGEFGVFLASNGVRLLIAIAVLTAGFWMANLLVGGLGKVLERRKTDRSLITFLRSLTSIALKTLVVITAVAQVGVEMTSFVALLGAAGLAIGIAFSGTLSNFAGGVMILMFKPFKVGDYIETRGEEGYVHEVLIFNTILKTLDNKTVILANGEVANGTIVNFSKAGCRRVDWTFGIAYGDDVKKAREVLSKLGAQDDRILKDPHPMYIGLAELADSSVNLTARAWIKPDDYWDVYFDMNERVYNEFAMVGLNIPYPQMDIHIQKENT